MSENSHPSEVAAIIMAGGAGTRLGPLGRTTPKCLLPLAESQTLLSRLILQLETAGIRQVTVCCSPKNHAAIQSALEAFRQQTHFSPRALTAVACTHCSLGPLPALAQALAFSQSSWRLLCLADVHFVAGDPFAAFRPSASGHLLADGCLLTGTDQLARDGKGSGAVRCEGGNVLAVSYRLPASETATNPMTSLRSKIAPVQRRWSGAYFFRESLLTDLQTHVTDYYHAPFESWIHGSLERGALCTWADAGTFVNVNSAEDYAFLTSPRLASTS